jgi:acyl-CoA synthetase (NDP forming)
MAAMQEYLPPHAALSNPIDMIASATPEDYERTIRLVGSSGQFDAIIVIYIPVMVTEPEEIAAAIVAGSRECNPPVLSCFMSSRGVPEAFTAAGEQIPSYRFPEEAARALAKAVEYGEFRRRPPGQVPELGDVNTDLLRYVVEGELRDGGGWMGPDQVNRLLEAASVTVAKTTLAKSVEDLAKLPDELNAPFAVKLVSDTILHKSDVGGVRLGVADADGLEAAFTEIQEAVARTGQPEAFQGVIVQEMARPGIEVAMGVVQHETFGPLMMLGTGGVMLELFQDVTFRIHPLTDVDAREMVEGLTLERLLQGYRGDAPKDREALQALLLRLSCLVEEVPEIAELDLNPVIVHDEGQGATVVDARIRLAPAEQASVVPLG